MAKQKQFTLEGNLVDVVNQTTYPAKIEVKQGKISKVEKQEGVEYNQYLMPGFIDAHVHIESSMLIPSEFARLAVPHGTIATVSDPHEIGNVMGVEGVHYMISNGKKVPFYFNFGAPSCVPATPFETSGAEMDAQEVESLLKEKDIKHLSEMMNYPGVLEHDDEVWKKLMAAKKLNKPIDGHAPGLKGDEARRYVESGISTDHECFTKEEALDKLKYGMNIIIREGSAAKNFDALISLLDEFPEKIMFCSDDKHPDDLVKGHINQLIKRALDEGIEPMKAIRAASYNPVKHYKLDNGLLQEGDPADLVVVDNWQDFNVQATYVKGELVAENGTTQIEPVAEDAVNNFVKNKIEASDLSLIAESESVQAIRVEDGQLMTYGERAWIKKEKGRAYSNPNEDVLKIVVVNRYEKQEPAVAFVKNFGLKQGAIASSVAHDSHNVVAVGVEDEAIANAVNLVMEKEGGISVADGETEDVLPLPVAGLMATEAGYQVAERYEALDQKAKALGATLSAPYMTLSFMALLVIPELKISDEGLFDGVNFDFTDVFLD